MDTDEEKSSSTPSAVAGGDNQTTGDGGAIPPPPIGPLPSSSNVAPTPFIPPRPQLAPIPVRPPAARVPSTQTTDTDMPDSATADGAVKSSALEYEVSEDSRLAKERQEKAIQELLMKRRSVALAVPTNDKSVRARLRRLGEPMTFFGEREMERRDRLRMLMAKLDSEGQLDKLMKAHDEEEAFSGGVGEEVEEDVQYPFYTEGSRSLWEARMHIAKYSVVRGALRLHQAKRRRDNPDEDFDAEVDSVLKQAGSLVLDCSEIGDDRPLSGCSLSPDGVMLATW